LFAEWRNGLDLGLIGAAFASLRWSTMTICRCLASFEMARWSGWKSSQNWSCANPQVENEQLTQQSGDRICMMWIRSSCLYILHLLNYQPDPPYKVVLQFCSAGWERLTVWFMVYIAIYIIIFYTVVTTVYRYSMRT
jgi:hypothetical protein